VVAKGGGGRIGRSRGVGRPLSPPEAVETVGGEAVGSEAAAAVSWARQGGGGHYLRAVRTRPARGSDRAADGRPHMVSLLSLNYPNQLNYKNQNGCLNLLQNYQIFACW
jgi:hypothetical protein